MITKARHLNHPEPYESNHIITYYFFNIHVPLFYSERPGLESGLFPWPRFCMIFSYPPCMLHVPSMWSFSIWCLCILHIITY